MSKLTGDRALMVMLGTALVMTDEILLLFSMITVTILSRLSVFELTEQNGFRTDWRMKKTVLCSLEVTVWWVVWDC